MNRIFRNASSTFFQVIVSGVLLFFLYRYLIHTIGADLLGVWAIILATTSIARLSEMGFSGSVVKFVAQYLARDDKENVAGVIGTAALSVAILVAVIILIAYVPLKLLLPYFIPPNSIEVALSIYLYAFLVLWVNSFAGVFLAGLDGAQRIDLKSYLVIITNVSYFGMVILFVPIYGFVGLAYAQLFQAFLLLLGSFFLLKQELFQTFSCLRWKKSIFLEMWRYSVNFQFASVMTLLYEPITKALLSAYSSLDVVGYYEMANRMVMQFRSVIVSINQVLVPVIANIMETKGSDIAKLYQKNSQWLLLVSLPYFTFILISTPLISNFWIGHYESNFVFFSVLLTVGWLINLLASPAYFSFLGIGRLRWNSISHAFIAFLNIVFAIVLGNSLGGIGVVLAWSIALSLGSMIIPVAYHIEYKIPACTVLPKYVLRVLFVCAVSSFFAISNNWIEPRFSAVESWFMYVCFFSLCLCIAVWKHPILMEMKDSLLLKG